MSDSKKSKIEKLKRQIQEKQNKSRRSVERIQNLLAEAKQKFGEPEAPRVRAILSMEKYRQIVDDEDESF